MKNLFGEVITSEPKLVVGSLPVASSHYRLATWYSPGQHWKLWPEEWLVYEKAVERSDYIEHNMRGHTYYVILEIKYPGIDKDQAQ